MLYPSLENLTNENVNRYRLVIATAKCARYVTQKANEARDIAEQRKEIDRFSKDTKTEMSADAANDKAVSVAIQKISSGEFKIV
jgi:DNA-directed RNA polymerase subunit K/omega